MLRRWFAAVILVMSLAVVALHADDFWVKKKWQDWSKDDCNKMLRDSPWSRKWSQSLSNNGPGLPSTTGGANAGTAGDAVNEIDYYAQIRSALPLREAIVRQFQIGAKYDKMTPEQKKSFDAQADAILNRDYSSAIVVHFVYETSARTFAERLSEYWQTIPTDAPPPAVYLINQRGDHIRPERYIAPRAGGYEFEMIFPRVVNNEPVVREGDKTIEVQFQEPVIYTFPSDLANFEFRIDKMTWDGKPAF